MSKTGREIRVHSLAQYTLGFIVTAQSHWIPSPSSRFATNAERSQVHKRIAWIGSPALPCGFSFCSCLVRVRKSSICLSFLLSLFSFSLPRVHTILPTICSPKRGNTKHVDHYVGIRPFPCLHRSGSYTPGKPSHKWQPWDYIAMNLARSYGPLPLYERFKHVLIQIDCIFSSIAACQPVLYAWGTVDPVAYIFPATRNFSEDSSGQAAVRYMSIW